MQIRRYAVIATALAALSGCASMSARDRDVAIGAAAGGVVGNVLTGGSFIGTVGGAAAGSIIGNEVNRSNRRR